MKKRIIYLLYPVIFILAISCFLPSCSKDNNSISLNQVGDWHVLQVLEQRRDNQISLQDSAKFELTLNENEEGIILLDNDQEQIEWDLFNNGQMINIIHTKVASPDANPYTLFDSFVITEDEKDFQEWFNESTTITFHPDTVTVLQRETWYLSRIK